MIIHTEYFLPKKKLSNSELQNIFPEFSSQKIYEKVGIAERAVSDENEYASDFAVQASFKLFKKLKLDINSVDFLIYCTQSPDYFLPTTACIIHEKLGLNKSAGAIDINQGCSGYIYGLAFSKSLIVSGVAKNVLLLTSDTYTKYLDPNDKGNRSIFGDGASATLISNSNNRNILNFSLGSDGSGAHNLIVKNSGIRNNTFCLKPTLFMNGTEIFNFTLKSIPNLINDVLIKNKLDLNDIDLFIFHQANKFMLNHLRRKIGIDKEKFIIDLESTGNTVSSTIPICINKYYKEFCKSKYILLCGFGVGYSWGACIIENKL